MLVLKVLYQYLIDIEEINDARTADIFLISSMKGTILLILIYCLLVLKVGPAFMSKRPPYKIQNIIRIYNIIQILLNLYTSIMGFIALFGHSQFNWTCFISTKQSEEELLILKISTITHYVKIFDFLDTIFFILRKKYGQVSFLHVYHHALMVFMACCYHKYAFATQFSMIGLVNSFIHVLMYLYYLLSSLNLNLNLNEWKRRLTQIQIIQFAFYAVYFIPPLLNNWCGLPVHWLIICQIQNTFILTLFYNFYYQTYIVKKAKNEKIK